MNVFDSVIAGLLALATYQSPDLSNRPFAPQIVPTQWAISCPSTQEAAKGRVLCTAEYLAYPRIFVNRTPEGMQIVHKAKCGLGRNKFGHVVPSYRPIALNIPLKESDTVKSIQRILLLNVRNFPSKIRKICGEAPPQSLKFEVDQSQMPAMIEAVFIRSEAR